MKRGRPIKYDNDEDRRRAIRESKSKYMLGKLWHCDSCDCDYSLAAKWMHMKTKKHIFNTLLKALDEDSDIELINEN